jgi:2-keto-4-pentenoate hydratase/2-oxohepta-3-ene-1,7-dioic acid hydratase in catechol pathway
MKLCRFNNQRLGIVDGDKVRDVTEALSVLPARHYPLPAFDTMVAAISQVRAAAEALTTAPTLRLEEATLLSPVANPGKLVAAPVNYQAHLDEAIADEATFSRAHVRKIQETGLFLKATSSLIGPGEPIRLSHPHRRTDHEVELAVVIGRECRRATREEALSYVAGYCIGLDITVRGPEERSMRKSLDTYSVLGPWMVTADELRDPGTQEIELDVDGTPRQRANTRDLIMGVPELIEFASAYYTLMPGDVIFTGTPEGVGPIEAGQTITASISGIGNMRVEVRDDAR